MNQSPEAVRARSERDRHFLDVIEAMLDSDVDSALTSLRLWDERRNYALTFEHRETATTRNEVTADQQEAANLRLLLTEVYEHFLFSENGLPFHLKRKVAKRLFPGEA